MKLTLALLAAALLILPALGQEATVRVAATGSASARVGGEEIMSVSPGLYLHPWQGRSFSAPTDQEDLGSVLTLEDGRVVCKAGVESLAEGFRLSYAMTPSTDLRVNSVHMSFTLPTSLWVGAEWSTGDSEGTIPAAFEQGQPASGITNLAITRPGGPRVVFDSTEDHPILLQDNRQWNSDNLEVRVGPQNGDGIDWAAGDTVTVIVEVDLGMPTEIERDQPVTLEASEEWVPFENRIEIAPGSALDWSHMELADGPAGKYGPVVVGESGHFEFADRPGEPVRFYGVNLCFGACYPTHAQADQLATRLRSLGYNSVRIHHYERDLIDQGADDSLTFREDQLDRFDYLMAACKREGLYVTTDVYVSRPVKRAEIFGAGEGNIAQDEFKMLVLVDEAAFQNLAEFARRFFGRVNPYTGMSLAEDPLLATLVVVNEGNGGNFVGGLEGQVREAWQQRWNEWLLERYGNREALANAWGDALGAGEDPAQGTVMPTGNGDKRQVDQFQFICQMHLRLFERMREVLQDELGCQALLTDQNGWTEPLANQVLRGEYDFVDSHMYWDHPSFLENPWQLPTRGWSEGRSAVAAGGAGARDRAMIRVLGKPFTISEFNYVVPNAHRAEGGLLMGAAAAIQDWDGLYRFSYSHQQERTFEPMGLSFFDLASDAINQSADRLAVALFLRGDLPPAEPLVAMGVPGDLLTADLESMPRVDGPLTNLAYTAKVGTALPGWTGDADVVFGAIDPSANEGVPAEVGPRHSEAMDAALKALRDSGALPAGNLSDPASRWWQSPDGGLLINGESGVATIDSERTAAIFRATAGSVDAGGMYAEIHGSGGMVWATSVDGQPLASSDRILVSHLTEILSSGMRFAELDRVTLQEWGGLPLLARRDPATISLTLDEPGAYSVYALATDGERLGEVAATTADGRLTFTADPGAFETGCIYYEIAR
jgi:hypothetical protein